MTTVRLSLRRLSVSSATIREAVPEHAMPTDSTPRNAASARPRSGSRAGPMRSAHFSGRPAVGGTSYGIFTEKLSLRLFALGRRQDRDTGQDQDCADDLRR